MSKIVTINPPDDAYRWNELGIDVAKMIRFDKAARAQNPGYRLGGKWGRQAYVPMNRVDCSGYIGWLLWNATDGDVDLVGMGSVDQRDALDAAGLKATEPAALALEDGVVRIAILPPRPVGHIAIVLNGATMESHGGRGVHSRRIAGLTWRNFAHCLVLFKP